MRLPIVILAVIGSAFAKAQWPKFYSYGFKEPAPPSLPVTDFGANFMQHKYDNNVSHIAAGYIYTSMSQGKIRADAAVEGIFESSFFNFNNVSSDGSIENTLYTYTGSLKNPQCSSYAVVPGFVIFPSDFLKSEQAVYGGTVEDEIWGKVAAWDILYQGVIPATVFLNDNDTVVRYDFNVPGPDRTFTTTRFFNIAPGPIDKAIFENPC